MFALEAAQARFRALENEPWLAVANLMQPDELSAFRVQHRRMAEMAERFTQTIRSVGLVPPAGALSGRVNPVLRRFAGVERRHAHG